MKFDLGSIVGIFLVVLIGLVAFQTYQLLSIHDSITPQAKPIIPAQSPSFETILPAQRGGC